jgi:hypothetical protein
METREALASLHKYYLNASKMKHLYELRTRERGFAIALEDDDWAEQWIYLSLWYATLFVVAEGWSELQFTDEGIEQLLSEEVKLNALRRFRNGVFHFQSSYHDDRFVDFVALGAASAEWVRALHSALGRDLLTKMRTIMQADG